MVSIVSSETVSGDTFFRNKPFDISFGVSPPTDVSMVLNTSPLSLGSNIISGNRIVSSSGFSSLGSQGTLFVSALSNGTTLASTAYSIVANSRIDVCWTSVGGVLPLFKFEPFSNTFTARVAGDTLAYPTSSTELLGYLTGTGTSNVSFRAPNGATTAYPYNLTLAVRAISGGSNVDEVSTTVTIKPARLVVSPCNASFIFYRNEPLSPVTFSILNAPISPTIFYSATTLPAGIALVKSGSNSFDLSGVPTVQTISSNYSFFAQDTSGRTYSTQVALAVNPERLLIDVSGTLSVSNIQADVPIDPITFTARFPPYTSDRAIRYSWTPLPPTGLQFVRKGGSGISGSFADINSSVDASFTMTLQGSIPESTIRSFALAKPPTNPYTMTLTGVRSSGGTALSPSAPKALSFRFGETIFFESNVPTFYVGLDTSASFTATTYFPSGGVDVSIASITLTDGFLPDGLTGGFTSNFGRFDISGIPTTAASYAFSLNASNSNATTKSIPVTLTISNDTARISPSSAIDICYTFIQYRSVQNGLTGFYTPPLRFTVGSDSGCNAILTGANLPTGVSLAQVSTGVYDLSGLPTTATALSTATLTATVPATGATASRTFKFSVSAEAIDISGPTLSFVQNVPITPVRFTATTKSGQPVIRFSSPSIPPTLDLGNTGDVTGTVIGSAPSGSFDVTAFTAYSSKTQSFPYTTTPDAVLLEPRTYTTVTAPGGTVSIPIDGYSLSAVTVSNYRFASAFPYGLTVNPTTGLLAGTLSTSLPSNVSFQVLGSAGLVDGSLAGTMTTTNLTTNRAQILRNDYNATMLPGPTTLYIYASDNNGVTWTQAHTESNNIYASTIGTNGSNLYLVPTSSNFLLTSSTGASYTRTDYDVSSAIPKATGILNKPGTSTWWMAGTRDASDGRGVFLYTSSNDGVTWTRGSKITTGSFTARDSNEVPSSSQWSPYIVGGVTLAYAQGILLLGGNRILRSTDEGQTWSTVTGGFTTEVANFSLEQSTVWVATGSDQYATVANGAYVSDANTICYSTDTGLTWTYASNTFTMNGYDLKYGEGAWMACGLTGDNLSGQYRQEVRYSFDAVNWTVLSSVPSPALDSITRPQSLFELGSLAFDETEWKLIQSKDETVTLYSHPYDLPMEYGWTTTDISGSFAGRTSATRFTSYVAQTIDPGADVTTITFPLPNTGPTFTSPAQSSFLFWHYMPIPPIVFTATDGGSSIQYFISPLPTGLRWTSTTRDVSGACMRTGRQTFTVYAKSGTGITAFPVTLIVDVPRIIKKQGGAGAYTALLRDYVEVNAAQAGRDTRALPTEVAGIGQLASPYPPAVVTPSNCPC